MLRKSILIAATNIFCVAAFVLFGPYFQTICAAEIKKSVTTPNFIIMIADDLSYTDLGCYGSANVKTPNLDSLASQGMKFEHCYNAIAMCVPTRNMLYTGLFPVRNGSYRNHTDSRPGTISMVPYFRQLGYRVGISGKYHVGPPKSYPFEQIPGLTQNCVSATDDYTFEHVKEFMVRDRNEPFFLVAGFIQPHVPWTMGDASVFDPEKLELPPHWADTPETRKSYAKYLAEVVFLDKQIGELLEIVDANDLRENTVVLFLSEQGAQFPGAKWNCWEQGLHAGAILRWPNVVESGRVSQALVQYVDVVPTFLDIARTNGAVPLSNPSRFDFDNLDLDGSSFLKVLLGKTQEHGKYAYGIHNNNPEGPHYPIRSVRTKEFSYVRNLLPQERYFIKWIQGAPNQPYYPSWKRAAEKHDARAVRAVQRNEQRPVEEFYDLRNDPWEMNNLIDSPKHRQKIDELRKALDDWMNQQNDPGAAVDVPLD